MLLVDALVRLRKSRRMSLAVTGPQRSGTTIAAHIFAEELGLEYVDENDVGIDSLATAVSVLRCGGVVLQCPGLAHVAHVLGKDATIVYMVRDVGDIVASQTRIKWSFNQHEIDKVLSSAAKLGASISSNVAAEAKYELWETQKRIIGDYIELKYDSLQSHRLWVPKELRVEFKPRQWK